MAKANLLAFLMIFPILLLYLLPFYLIWGIESFEFGRQVLMGYIIATIFIGTVIHELLHGVTWAIFAKKGLKSIKFGVNWKWITPYCHCKESLKLTHYFLGTIMPLMVMGIIPSIIALFIGNGFLLAFGILFSWAAGGDIISAIMLIRLDRNTLVFDHPSMIGFYILQKPNTEIK